MGYKESAYEFRAIANDYRRLLDQAQAEIACLQAELACTRIDAQIDIDTAWNDAIEAALSELHWLCADDKAAIRALRRSAP